MAQQVVFRANKRQAGSPWWGFFGFDVDFAKFSHLAIAYLCGKQKVSAWQAQTTS